MYNFEMIQSDLDLKLLMLHLCSIFVWIVIKIQWLPLILNGKRTGKTFVYMKRFILFVLIDWGFVLKFQFTVYKLQFNIFQFHKEMCSFCPINKKDTFSAL